MKVGGARVKLSVYSSIVRVECDVENGWRLVREDVKV